MHLDLNPCVTRGRSCTVTAAGHVGPDFGVVVPLLGKFRWHVMKGVCQVSVSL